MIVWASGQCRRLFAFPHTERIVGTTAQGLYRIAVDWHPVPGGREPGPGMLEPAIEAAAEFSFQTMPDGLDLPVTVTLMREQGYQVNLTDAAT